MRLAAIHSRRTLGLLAIATASLAACSQITENIPTINRYAALNITARPGSSGTARGTATLIVFEAVTIAVPNSTLQQTDQCIISGYDTLSVPTRGQKRLATAPAVSIGGAPLPLVYNDTLARYATAVASPFAYRAGDQVQVTIPEDPNSFPASAIGVRLAEPVIPGAIAVPAAGTALSISWNGTNDPTSAIALSLRYANPASSPYANEQVYCLLRDDGTHDLIPLALTNFYNSPVASRSLTLSRWRTAELQPDKRSLLHVATSYDTTVAVR